MPITEVISSFPPAPDAGLDTPEQFSNKADAFVAHQANVYVGEVNSWATEANTLATGCNTNETMSSKWAEEAEDVEVTTGEYSAHHWATKAINTVGITTPTFPADEGKVWAARQAGNAWQNSITTEQEDSVGTPIDNALILTQAEYDGLASPVANNLYFIVG